MSGLQTMRPAARSAAMRPHSSSLPSPRPASAASSCFTSLFFVSAPRPVEEQSYWLARACSHSGWEQLAGWERVGEQESRAFSGAYATVPAVPSPTRPRIMHARAYVYGNLSLCLGTWKHSWIVEQIQWLALFPRLFPAPRLVGTWEQSGAPGLRPGCLGALANKVEAGNGDPQRPGGDARQKFRAPIAGGELEQQLRTRRCDNGGNPGFSARLVGHVGRLMLEGLPQAADLAAFPVARLKLGRLRGRHLGELTLLGRSRAPGAPNRGRRSPAMLALHAGRIWIEKRAQLRGHYSDRRLSDRESAQTVARQRGPGGIRISKAATKAERAHNRRAWKWAGVNCPAPIARPHEAGEFAKLRCDFAAVNGRTA